MVRYRVLQVAGRLKGWEGITDYLLLLAKNLIRNDVEVAFATEIRPPEASSTYAQKAQALRNLEAPYYRTQFFDFRSLGIGELVAIYRSFQQLKAAVDAFQPDIMHVHSLSACPIAYLVYKWCGVPFITTCHSQPINHDQRAKKGKVISKLLQKILGEGLVTLSHESRQGFEDLLDLPREDLQLIHTGIDTNYFRPPSRRERLEARNDYGLPHNATVICDIASFSPRKSHKTLVNAFTRLKGSDSEAICICAGTGTHEQEIRSMVEDAGMSETFKFLGYTDARRVLWASDVLVLPSYREAFPLVILEAMSCGVIPVRTPAGGAAYQVEHGIDGYIFPFDDDEALAQILNQLIDDAELRDRISKRAREKALRSFTQGRMIQSYLKVYEDVLSVQRQKSPRFGLSS